MQIRFPSPDSRSAFADILRQRDPYLFSHTRLLYGQPDVAVVVDIDGHASRRLRALLSSFDGGRAQIYNDVSFETFA